MYFKIKTMYVYEMCIFMMPMLIFQTVKLGLPDLAQTVQNVM